MKKLFVLLLMLLLAQSASATVALRMDDGAVLADADGYEIVPFGVYEDIVPLGRELYAAVRDEKCALMDADGRLLGDFVFDRLKLTDGLLLGSIGGRQCILNPDGSLRTDAAYGLIVPNGAGGAWAIRGTNGDVASDELLIIAPDGKEKPGGIYVRSMDQASGSGLLAVLPSDASSYIYCDTSGKPAVQSGFDTAGTFENGLAVVSVGGSFGVIDDTGKMVLPADYSFADVSEEGMILGVGDDGVVLCDADGKILMDCAGEGYSAAFAGEYIQLYDGEKLQIHAPDGSLLMTLDADAAVYPGIDGQLIISDGAWGEACVYLDGWNEQYRNLHPLGHAQGNAVYAFMEVRVARYMNNLLDEVQITADMDTARYGLINSAGEILLPARYLSIDWLKDDRFLVQTEKEWRMTDSKGRVYWKRDAQ